MIVRAVLLGVTLVSMPPQTEGPGRIGSKAFPESWILGEAAAIRIL